MIARHFGETWDSSRCNKMCDHCDKNDNVSVQSQDVSTSCKAVLHVLEDATMKNQRLTGQKVIDAMSKKSKEMTKEDIEKVVVKMILDGYLREDFHFTPYSTISYLVPGAMAQVLSASQMSVMMDFQNKNSKRIANAGGRPTPTSAQGSKDNNIPKPKLSVINPKKSKFASNLMTVDEESDSDVVVMGVTNSVTKNDGRNKQGNKPRNNEMGSSADSSKSVGKKRKSVDKCGNSDDDLAEFDFGDDVKLKPSKVCRKSTDLESSGKASSASGSCRKKRRSGDILDDYDCVVQSNACNKPEHSPAKKRKSTADSESHNVENGALLADVRSHVENGVDGDEIDDIDGRNRLRCCIAVDNSDNDEPDGLGNKMTRLAKNSKKSSTKDNQNGAEDKAETISSKGTQPGCVGTRLDSEAGPPDQDCVNSTDLSVTGHKSSIAACSDGIHCGEDSDSDEADAEKESVKLGRYAVRYTKDPGKSSENVSPVKKELAAEEIKTQPVHSSKDPAHSSKSYVQSSKGPEHSSDGPIQSSTSSMHFSESFLQSGKVSIQSGEGSVHYSSSSVHSSKALKLPHAGESSVGSSGDQLPVHSSVNSSQSTRSPKGSQLDSVPLPGPTSSGTSVESKSSRSSKEMKVKSNEGGRSRPQRQSAKDAVEKDVTKGMKRRGKKVTEGGTGGIEAGGGEKIGGDGPGKCPRRRTRLEPPGAEAFSIRGDHSVDPRERQRRRRLKKRKEMSGTPLNDGKKEGATAIPASSTSDSLDGTNSKAIVRGVFNKLRQSRGLSDENSTLTSTSSRESTLTGKDTNLALRNQGVSDSSLKLTKQLRKSTETMSKSLSFKPYSYFEKPLGRGGARPKEGETLPVLKKSNEHEKFEPLPEKQGDGRENLSKLYAFGEASDPFKSWIFRQQDSSSSTTTDTTPSSVHVSHESLQSVESLVSEEAKAESEEDMGETIQSPKTGRKFANTQTDTTEKVERSPLAGSTVSSTQGDMSISSGHGDTTTNSSVEMSELYNMYAKQLDTLDIVDSSSENETRGLDDRRADSASLDKRKRRPKKSRLRTLAKSVGKSAISEMPDSDDSVGSTGSLEKSMYNLEKLPAVAETRTAREEASDSEGDFDEICDVYLDQLHHMKR